MLCCSTRLPDVLLDIRQLQLMVWEFIEPTVDTAVVDELAKQLFDGFRSTTYDNSAHRLSYAYSLYSSVLKRRGDVFSAARYLRESLALAKGNRDSDLAERHFDLAELLFAAGDLEGAHAAALVARAIYSELGRKVMVLAFRRTFGANSQAAGQVFRGARVCATGLRDSCPR